MPGTIAKPLDAPRKRARRFARVQRLGAVSAWAQRQTVADGRKGTTPMSEPVLSRRTGPAFTLALLVASLAQATVVKDESIETMTAHAHSVVRGTVRSVQPMLDEHAKIWTYVEVAVTETLKGDVPRLLLVKQPGGELGGKGQWVAGVARFEPGQDCVLFLERATDEARVHVVYALAAGKVDFEPQGADVAGGAPPRRPRLRVAWRSPSRAPPRHRARSPRHPRGLPRPRPRGRARCQVMRALLALAALAALPAFATPSGHMWFQTTCSTRAQCEPTNTCVSSKCVPEFRLAASIDNSGATTVNGPQHLAYSTFLSRAPVAFAKWTTANVSACATSYQVSSGGTFSAPAGIAAVNGSDGANNVIWLSGGNWRYSSATLGLTTGTFVTSTGQLIDADMELNDNVDWTDNGDTTAYDMESVVLHEAGHFLGLDHTTTIQAAVMYPTVAFGNQKRALASPDTTDVCTVYPGAAGSQGYAVHLAVELHRRARLRGRAGRGPRRSAPRTAPAPAPRARSATPASPPTRATPACRRSARRTCASSARRAPTARRACASPTALVTTGARCRARAPPSAARATSCAGGLLPADRRRALHQPVHDRVELRRRLRLHAEGPASPPATPAIAARSPSTARAATSASSTPTTTRSRSAARAAAARARARTAPPAPRRPAALHRAACRSPTARTPSASPRAAGTLCNACSGQTCGAGMTCIGGSCHSSCNPASPGACPACLDIGGGQAVCACTNEVAGVGDPCGVTSTSLLACANGAGVRERHARRAAARPAT